MRVLHVYSGNLYGGVETMLVTLALHRDLCVEIEPSFALCFEGRLSEELVASGAPMHQLGHVHASQPGSVLRARRMLLELLGQESFDAVICHAPWSLAIFGPVVRRARLPLVFWQHGPATGRHWTERWARRTPPDLVLCNSRFTAKTLPKLYPRTRAEVLYCPVAFSEKKYSEKDRLAARAELNTPQDAVVIIQVGRMEALKGHTFHLETLGTLNDLPNWVCWMVGGAQRNSEVSYCAELRALATRLGISERVRFVGQRTDVARLLQGADIYCQPNTHPDAFGIAIVEALDAKLPVVTTAIGGVREIINDTCGFEIQPYDVSGLSVALRRLIQDRGLREKLGRAGKTRAHCLCDLSTQMQRLRDCLVETCVR